MDIPGFFGKLGYSTSLRRKIIIYFLIMSVLPILLLSYWAYDYGKTSTESRVTAHLTSIADLKKNELKGWLSDRLGNLRTLSESQDIGLYLLGYDTDADGSVVGRSLADERLFSHIQDELQSLKTNYGYRRIFVVDLSGKVVVSTEKDDVGRILNEVDLSKYLAAREIYIEDIFRSQGDDILMVFSTPVYGFNPVKRKGIPAMRGILILEMDMEKTVFPMIGQWPGMGQTGETLLVRREGGEVLFLNELRHKKGSALNLRIPVDSALATPAIFASEGDEGILRARDYRGVEVLSAYRHIPIMDWGFVAKINQDEAFAMVTSLRNKMILLSSLLILAAIGLAVWISSGITRPILSLEKLTGKIASGDFSVYPEVKTRDEIGSLADSLGKMESALEKSRNQLMNYSRTLEGKVRERTKELRESEEKYRAIFSEARDGIVLIDAKTGCIVDCNPEFERQTGRTLEELRKMKIWEVRSPEKAETAKKKFFKLMEKRTGGSSELEFQGPDGKNVPIEFGSTMVKIRSRQYIQSIARDITERKKLEEELLQSQKMEAVGQLAGGIAHDFNNILTAIMNYGNVLLMKMGKGNDLLRSYVDAIIISSKRAAALTHGLLSFSRKQIMNPVLINLNDIVSGSEERFVRTSNLQSS